MAKKLVDLCKIKKIESFGLAFSRVDRASLFSRAIHLVTGGKHTHVDIWLNGSLLVTVDPLNGGVQAFEPDAAYVSRQDYIDLTHCIAKYSLDIDYGLNWLQRQKGKGYDWLNILLCQFIPFRADRKSKWICSELATAFLQECKLPVTSMPKHVNPKRLYDIVNKWFR